MLVGVGGVAVGAAMIGDRHVFVAHEARRLDQFVSESIPGVTRTAAQRFIAEGKVLVDGSPSRNSYRLRVGQTVSVEIPAPKPLTTVAENLPLSIVYEDEDIIVVDKSAGMVVHPAFGHRSGTLVNALLHHVEGLADSNSADRPGIVHRLDKNTSGLLVVAKNNDSLLRLQRQLAMREMGREYLALVHGCPKLAVGTVDAPIGRHRIRRKEMAVDLHGRRAVTHYQVLESYGAYALVKCKLETGRTHQIRVHLAYIGHPVVGDDVYGPRKPPLKMERHMLHAARLTLHHPTTGELMSFISAPPKEFECLLLKFKGKLGDS